MTQSTTAGEQTKPNGAAPLQFALAAAELAYNTRCVDVVVIDLRGRSPVTEFFVIATGTSPRQMRTAVEEMQDLGKKMGFAPWKTNGLESGTWILLDCVNVVCHLFDSEGRDFYDLELLWGDCPKIDWRKELGLPPATERPLEESGFSEKSRLDQIDAEEEEERELTELEEDEEADEDADIEPAVVVELPDESSGPAAVELVEIDPPSQRGKREHALYPTKIAEQTNNEEEGAMHVLRTSEAAEALDELDEEKPARSRKPAKKAKAAKKKPAKSAAKSVVKKSPAKKKLAAKKKPAAKPKKKPIAKKPAKKKPAKKKR